MQTQGQIWIFFDSESKKKTKPMPLIEAQMMVLSLKSRQAKRFFIWTPGWAEWKNLDQYLKQNQSYFALAPSKISQKLGTKKKSSTTDPDEITVNISESRSILTSVKDEPRSPKVTEIDYEVFDFHGDHLKMRVKPPAHKLQSQADHRKDVRYECKFDIILVSKSGKSFRTTSENISLGGALLESPIPREFLGTQFDLIIVNKFEKDPKRSRMLFKGKIVGDVSDPRRLTFIEPAYETVEKLSYLLKNYTDLSNAPIAKKTGS